MYSLKAWITLYYGCAEYQIHSRDRKYRHRPVTSRIHVYFPWTKSLCSSGWKVFSRGAPVGLPKTNWAVRRHSFGTFHCWEVRSSRIELKCCRLHPRPSASRSVHTARRVNNDIIYDIGQVDDLRASWCIPVEWLAPALCESLFLGCRILSNTEDLHSGNRSLIMGHFSLRAFVGAGSS